MAGKEFGRRLGLAEVNEFSPLERFGKELTSHVTHIQKRFDTKVAESIGFEGNLFDAFKSSIKQNPHSTGSENTISIDMEKMPEHLKRFINLEKLDYAADGGSMYPSLALRDKIHRYKISFNSLTQAEIKLINTDIAAITFTKQADRVISAQVTIRDYYNFGDRNFPTQRRVALHDKEDALGVMTIGQERATYEVNPLFYGNLDRDGNLFLLPEQGIYTNSGSPDAVDWNEKKNRVTVKVKDERFYFPIIVNPHAELITASTRLGI